MTSIKKWPKFKNDPNSKITQNQKWPKTNNVPNSKMTQNYIKKWCNGPARRRRAGRRLVRFAFARPSSLFCVPVLFLFLYLLWVYVFYGFYVGPAKLQRDATPPSVLVLFFFKLFLMDISGGGGGGASTFVFWFGSFFSWGHFLVWVIF